MITTLPLREIYTEFYTYGKLVNWRVDKYKDTWALYHTSKPVIWALTTKHNTTTNTENITAMVLKGDLEENMGVIPETIPNSTCVELVFPPVTVKI